MGLANWLQSLLNRRSAIESNPHVPNGDLSNVPMISLGGPVISPPLPLLGDAPRLPCVPAPLLFPPSRPLAEKTVIAHPRLGILNLLGAQAEGIVTGDRNVIAPLFESVEESTDLPPACDVLFLYCELTEDNRILGSQSTLREIIRDAGARIVIVATENSFEACLSCSKPRPYGQANLVMTFGRDGERFGAFFVKLFEAMHQGQTMPVAWNRLAPQVPEGVADAKHAQCPRTIFWPELGQLSFT